jgi:hypothetical protein
MQHETLLLKKHHQGFFTIVCNTQRHQRRQCNLWTLSNFRHFGAAYDEVPPWISSIPKVCQGSDNNQDMLRPCDHGIGSFGAFHESQGR